MAKKARKKADVIVPAGPISYENKLACDCLDVAAALEELLAGEALEDGAALEVCPGLAAIKGAAVAWRMKARAKGDL